MRRTWLYPSVASEKCHGSRKGRHPLTTFSRRRRSPEYDRRCLPSLPKMTSRNLKHRTEWSLTGRWALFASIIAYVYLFTWIYWEMIAPRWSGYGLSYEEPELAANIIG